jgi:hypothetical protein
VRRWPVLEPTPQAPIGWSDQLIFRVTNPTALPTHLGRGTVEVAGWLTQTTSTGHGAITVSGCRPHPTGLIPIRGGSASDSHNGRPTYGLGGVGGPSQDAAVFADRCGLAQAGCSRRSALSPTGSPVSPVFDMAGGQNRGGIDSNTPQGKVKDSHGWRTPGHVLWLRAHKARFDKLVTKTVGIWGQSELVASSKLKRIQFSLLDCTPRQFDAVCS